MNEIDFNLHSLFHATKKCYKNEMKMLQKYILILKYMLIYKNNSILFLEYIQRRMSV